MAGSVFDISCCNTGGGGSGGGVNDKYYEATFSNALVVTILGSAHLFGRKPSVNIYHMGGTEGRANINVNLTNFDVTVTFNQQRSGVIILT